jgi:hypothetical protein
MPIAIVLSTQGAVPAILAEDTAEDLVARLAALKEAPEFKDQAEARLWLQGLPAPSGWFHTVEEAKAHVQRMQEPAPMLAGATVATARKALGMGRAQFATALGMGGNDNTRHKSIHDIEIEAINKSSGRRRVLNPAAVGRLQALLAEKGLEELLN